jgi:hypothetical protein
MNPPDQPTPRTNAAWAKTFESELNQFWSGNAANQMREECEKLERELAAEREKVRVLREALDEAQSCGGLTRSIFMQARAALAATEGKTP